MDYLLPLLFVSISFALIAACSLALFRCSFTTRLKFSIAVFVCGFIVNMLLLEFNRAETVLPLDNVLHSFYNSLLMFLGNGSIEPMNNAPVVEPGLHLRVLQFIKWGLCVFAVSITASAVVSIIGSQISSHLRVLFTRPEEVCIFYGFSEEAKMLARSLKSAKPSSKRLIAFVSTAFHESHVSDYLGKGTTMTAGIPLFSDDRFVLSKAKRKKLKLFLFDVENKDFIGEVHRVVNRANHDSYQQLSLFIFTKQDWMRELLESEPELKEIARILDPSLLRARHLTNLIPASAAFGSLVPESTATDSMPQNKVLLLGGLGHTGQELLRQVIMNGQYPGYALSLDIVDKDASNKCGAFEARFPFYRKVCTICFHSIHASSPEFFNLLAQGTFDYIIIDLGHERSNIKAALDINNWYFSQGKKAPLLAVSVDSLTNTKSFDHKAPGSKTTGTEKPEDGVTATEGSFDSVWNSMVLFGANEQIFTEGIVLKEELDALAKKINAFYSMSAEDRIDTAKVQAAWDRLSFWHKESSRASADYQPTMKALASHKDITDLKLAQAEHARWNAFHCMNGFKPMDKAVMRQRFTEAQRLFPEADAQTWGNYARQDTELNKRHICLVDWDELDQVSADYNSLPENPGYLDKAYSGPALKPRDFKESDYDVIALTKNI